MTLQQSVRWNALRIRFSALTSFGVVVTRFGLEVEMRQRRQFKFQCSDELWGRCDAMQLEKLQRRGRRVSVL